MNTLLTLALSLLALPASAKEPGIKPPAESGNYRITFTIKDADTERTGSFTVMDGSQSNYIVGGETAVEPGGEKGKTVELRKNAVIVNCLPKSRFGDQVAVACQFELSTPSQRAGVTFQFQSEFLARKGRQLTLVDEPGRLIKFKIEDSPL